MLSRLLACLGAQSLAQTVQSVDGQASYCCSDLADKAPHKQWICSFAGCACWDSETRGQPRVGAM